MSSTDDKDSPHYTNLRQVEKGVFLSIDPAKASPFRPLGFTTPHDHDHLPQKGPSSGTWKPRSLPDFEKAVANAEESARAEYQYRQDKGQPATMERIYCELIADAERHQAMVLESLRYKEEALVKSSESKTRLLISLTQLRDSPALKDQPVLQAAIIGILAMSK